MQVDTAHHHVAYKEEAKMETNQPANETCSEEPRILEEIQVEELAIDGICGVY